MKKTFITNAILMFIISLFFCVSNIYGEGGEPNNIGKDEEIVIKKLELEKNIEERLVKDIGAYLGKTNFIVQVKVGLKKIVNAVTTEKIPAVSQTDKLPLPQVPTSTPVEKKPAGNETEKEQQNIYLPGIPISDVKNSVEIEDVKPEAVVPPVKKVQEIPKSDFFETYTISKVNIKLILNEDIPGVQEEFIRKLIYEKASLNSARGDTLDVVKTDFPTNKTDDIPETIPPPNLVDSSTVDKFFEYLDYFTYYFKYLLPILLLLTLIMVFLMLKFVNRNKVVTSPNLQGGMSAYPQFSEPVTQTPIIPKTDAQSEQERARKEDDKLGRDILPLKQEIVTLMLDHPEIGVNYIEQILPSDEGVRNSAMLFKTIGFQASEKLFSGLNVENRKLIESYFSEKRDFTNEEVYKLLESAYYSMLSEKASLGDIDNTIKPFEFLEKLDDSQIVYILMDEGIKVKTLVFSQLPPGKAATLLKKLPLEEQGRIAEAIGDFESIPVPTFKDVAERLAKKALYAPNFSTLTADGVSLLIDLLDNSDSVTEKQILDSLKIQNPELLRKVKDVYFTFSDISLIPSNILKDIVRDINRNNLSIAIKDMDDDVREKILNSLPEKVSIMMRDNFETLGVLDGAKVEEARNSLVKEIRMFIQTGRFAMRDLEVES